MITPKWNVLAVLFLTGAGFVGLIDFQGAALAEPVPVPYGKRKLSVAPPPVATDATVRFDYDIVYVRAPRKGNDQATLWADVFRPFRMEADAPLVLLHPDGKEEVLVPVEAHESIADPFVSFDGQSVYYAKFHDLRKDKNGGADIYRIHVPTRKIVRLTHQEYTANQGDSEKTPRAVYNLGPCPVPGGKVAFTSTRNGFRPPKGDVPVLQLFVMDDDGSNVDCIGHLNIGGAMHPVILKDGRLMFSSLESQGLRGNLMWGIWSIHPDGTNWGPMLSAFRTNTFHFQTQLSDGALVVEEYYESNNFGFGSYHKFPVQPPSGSAPFGPASPSDPRNPLLPPSGRLPFSPHGIQTLTLFAPTEDSVARLSDPADPKSMRVGKVTHPSGAPDNHCLTVWSPGAVNQQHGLQGTAPDAGIYLLKSGQQVEEPGQMALVKNDPKYNEQWPRALVPYQRIYGSDEPARLPALRNNGGRCKHLPEGTPFGLVGTSSLYKRESYPGGAVPKEGVTATYAGGQDPWRGLDPFVYYWATGSRNWKLQGADAGLYDNSAIHAIRILAMEPTSVRPGRRFYNHAGERLRILGEIPVRKFPTPGADATRLAKGQPLDPDGNPDTSFLARIPADLAFTFQAIDKDSMTLNAAQTWHQVRPGEIRNDCGGCHAHSQKPTLFKDTAAAQPDYKVWDLASRTPLLTTRKHDQSGVTWDDQNEAGLRFDRSVKNVEFHRDVKPILERSCVACHTQKWDKPAGNLVLDDDKPQRLEPPYPDAVPGSYRRLALDHNGRFGHKPLGRPLGFGSWGDGNASRYVRMFQSRRSLLIWKVYGRRLDGWNNDDFTTEAVPGDPNSVQARGQGVDAATGKFKDQPGKAAPPYNLAYLGSAMPPLEAIAGTYEGPHGQKIKVEPLTDEDRRTLVRWIDLGCPIDLSYDPAKPSERGPGGWMFDDQRPTLTLTYPKAGANEPLTRILVGMHDYDSGLDMSSFTVTADFPLAGVAPGENLAPQFKQKTDGVWELNLGAPLQDLPRGKLIVSIKDKQGNLSRIERQFSVTAPLR